MAFVPVGAGSGFFLSVTLVDNSNSASNLQYPLRSADYATALTDTAAILTAIAGVTDSVVQSYNISYRAQNDAFAFPASGVENEIKARISVQLDGVAKKATIDIPAPKPGIFQAPAGEGANIVDILDTDLGAYADLFESTGKVYISDGEDLAYMLRGRRVSVRRGMR